MTKLTTAQKTERERRVRLALEEWHRHGLEKYPTQEACAKAHGLNGSTFSRRLRNVTTSYKESRERLKVLREIQGPPPPRQTYDSHAEPSTPGDQTGMTTHKIRTIYYDTHSKGFMYKAATKTLPPLHVLIRTTHSGLCTTDVHAKHKGCGLGHEGVGLVERLGKGVNNLSLGQRVGWGWLHSSCGHCRTCSSGYRQYCSEARGFAFSDTDQGAFSTFRIINAAFVYPIPESIQSIHAGPLMCAGASTYEALDAAGTRPGDRVGIVGVGGLGHMGILFAKAMGCGVTAITSAPSKVSELFKLGADEVRNVNNLQLSYTKGTPTSDGQDPPTQTTELPQPMSIDVLLITSNTIPDLSPYFGLLARRATIVLMTIQQAPISVPYMSFVLPGHKLIASTEASHRNHFEMLAFAARHKIEPVIEEFPMTLAGAAAAFEKLEAGNMRYRGVLVRETVVPNISTQISTDAEASDTDDSMSGS